MAFQQTHLLPAIGRHNLWQLIFQQPRQESALVQAIWMRGFVPSISFCAVYLRGMRLSVPCTSSLVMQDTCYASLSRKNSTVISQQLHCTRSLRSMESAAVSAGAPPTTRDGRDVSPPKKNTSWGTQLCHWIRRVLGFYSKTKDLPRSGPSWETFCGLWLQAVPGEGLGQRCQCLC